MGLSDLELEKEVEKECYKQAEQYINQWQKQMGWDYVLDLIKKYRHLETYKFYKAILEKKGFKLED